MITKAQRKALEAYAADFEAPDYDDFASAGPALGWINRDRVITALQRKGLIDNDQHITDAGRAVLKGGDP